MCYEFEEKREGEGVAKGKSMKPFMVGMKWVESRVVGGRVWRE